MKKNIYLVMFKKKEQFRGRVDILLNVCIISRAQRLVYERFISNAALLLFFCDSVTCTQTRAFPHGLYALGGNVLDQITDMDKPDISPQLPFEKMAKTLLK